MFKQENDYPVRDEEPVEPEKIKENPNQPHQPQALAACQAEGTTMEVMMVSANRMVLLLFLTSSRARHIQQPESESNMAQMSKQGKDSPSRHNNQHLNRNITKHSPNPR